MHEAGHLALMKLLGIRVKGIRAELKGLCIIYDGNDDSVCSVACALAGPAAGMIYALAASQWGSGWIEFSAGVSFALSVFNLLPAFPLDGGRILSELMKSILPAGKCESVSAVISVITAFAVFLFGLALYNRGYGAAVFSAGLWLLICQNETLGIVKNSEIS